MDLIRWYPSTRTAYTYRPDGLRYGKTYGSGADATGVTHLWDGQNWEMTTTEPGQEESPQMGMSP